MGIEFTKRDVKPSQAVKDQLQKLIGGDIKSIRKKLKKEPVAKSVEHTEFIKAEKFISNMSRLLLKPPEKEQSDDVKATSRIEASQEQDNIDRVCKFSAAQYGVEGPIYSAEQRGKIIYIDLNIDHSFYKRFVMENQDGKNREKMMATYYLIYSMASAELNTFNEEQEKFISSYKTMLSINLRTLLE